MMHDTQRTRLIRRLLETACRSMAWNKDARTTPALRLADALAAHTLELRVDGVRLSAWITQELELEIDVHVERWNRQVEEALRNALAQSSSLVAGVILTEWPKVKAACAARRPAEQYIPAPSASLEAESAVR